MFITLTIDTNIKNKQKVKLNKSKINPAFGWRKNINIKKRSLWQKIMQWRKKAKTTYYKMGGQIAMF